MKISLGYTLNQRFGICAFNRYCCFKQGPLLQRIFLDKGSSFLSLIAVNCAIIACLSQYFSAGNSLIASMKTSCVSALSKDHFTLISFQMIVKSLQNALYNIPMSSLSDESVEPCSDKFSARVEKTSCLNSPES